MTRRNDNRQFGLPLDGVHYPIPQAPTLVAGSLGYAHELCGTLSQAISECQDSRAVIAARMSDLTGEPISEAMLNAWTAQSHDRHRFPFEFAAAFEVATSSTRLQGLLAHKRGSLVLIGKQALDAQLGKVQRQISNLKLQERDIKKAMKGEW